MSKSNANEKVPIILCFGANGRGLLFGYVDTLPEAGAPVVLENARCILYYPSGGTLGLAAKGPPDGSRVTAAVPKTMETVWQEWILCTPAAAEAFDACPEDDK